MSSHTAKRIKEALPVPWIARNIEPVFEAGAILFPTEGGSLYCPLPDDRHPRVRIAFEVRGDPAVGCIISMGAVCFGLAGRNAAECEVYIDDQRKACPVATDQWHQLEIEADRGRYTLRLNGALRLEVAGERSAAAFGEIVTKHPPRQRIRNLTVDYDPPDRAAKPQQRERFDMAMVVDFADDVYWGTPFTRDTFVSMFDHLANWRMSRVYWRYDLTPQQYRATQAGPEIVESMCHAGDMHRLVCDLAHERGMELFFWTKPFDLLGWSAAELGRGNSCDAVEVGGRTLNLPLELAGHAEALIQRRPVATSSAPIGELIVTSDGDRPVGFDPEAVRIWVSDDNRCYQLYGGPRVCRCDQNAIRFSGLHIVEPYIALTPPNHPGAGLFGNTYRHLIEVRSVNGDKLPFTLGLLSTSSDFRDGGILFDQLRDRLSSAAQPMDFIDGRGTLRGDSGFVGIARGKNTHLPVLSTSHPRTQAALLSMIRSMIAAGCDGVDLRIRHHQTTMEWSAYGFESPVAEAFKERYGVDICKEDFDREAWRRLRGEHYTDFLRRAADLLHSAGCKLQHHVSLGMDRPPSRPTLMHMHFDWRSWIEQGIVDAITNKQLLKTNAFLQEVLDVAHAHDVPVYDCPYTQHMFGNHRFDLTPWRPQMQKNASISRSAGLDGWMLYESAHLLRSKGDRVEEAFDGLGDFFRNIRSDR